MSSWSAASATRADDILAAAPAIFLRYGFARTSIDLIARERAGMSAEQAASFVGQCAYALPDQPRGDVPTPAQYDRRFRQSVGVIVAGLDGK